LQEINQIIDNEEKSTENIVYIMKVLYHQIGKDGEETGEIGDEFFGKKRNISNQS
jgi:hypothetical protein